MTQVGNEENMAKIRELRNMQEATEEVKLGAEATNTVIIDYVSEYGNHYKGAIVFKRPSVMEFMKMGGIKSEILRLNGVQDLKLVDAGVKYMAQVMATLKTVAVKRPEWLINIDNVKDTDLLFHVYEQYTAWEDSFRTKFDATDAEGGSEPTE